MSFMWKIPADEAFYHCPLCNFTLDFHCVFNPRPVYHDDLNIHDHKLTLMPKSISFTCTICGLNGDRSPYVCLLGVVKSVCKICQKKMDWSCGGYFCKRCPNSVFHTKCATRNDVWDGIEMKDEPEEDEDIESFKVIDKNTIRYFMHDHNLSLHRSGVFVDERRCEACAYPIYQDSFYNCMSCRFMLHESCANMPKRKRHMTSIKQHLLTRHASRHVSKCGACGEYYNGFLYGDYTEGFDIRCASVSEPFVHKSHPHPLYYTSPNGVCSVCNKEAKHVLRCVEDHCEYIMDFKCALLPYEVKHRVDDHFLSLCYGEKSASGKYWCDICEKETDSKTWFYTCKECGVTLHTDCVIGDSQGFMPRSIVSTMIIDDVDDGIEFKVVSNSSMSRPTCRVCNSRCIFLVCFKELQLVYQKYSLSFVASHKYFCSLKCARNLKGGDTFALLRSQFKG